MKIIKEQLLEILVDIHLQKLEFDVSVVIFCVGTVYI